MVEQKRVGRLNLRAASLPECRRRRLHCSRRCVPTLHRAPRTEDGRLVPAGLLARGSDARPDLPDRSGPLARGRGAVSGIYGQSSPLTVAGAASVLLRPLTRLRRTVFPIHPPMRRAPWPLSQSAKHNTGGDRHAAQGIDHPRHCQADLLPVLAIGPLHCAHEKLPEPACPTRSSTPSASHRGR